MTTAATATADARPADTGGIRPFLGTALTRVVVPLWLLAGALFKFWTLDPRLLPEPVRDFLQWLSNSIGSDYGPFLMFSFRSMVAVELVLVGVMFFVPKYARAAAIAILSLFCAILLVEVVYIFQGSDFAKKGFKAFLAPCGCFGSKSPPTIVTLAIDATLLLGCILCAPFRGSLSIPRWPMSGVAGVASLVVGFGLAFGKPERVIENPHATEPVAVDGTNGNAETPPATPNDASPTKTAGGAPPWPAAPEKLKASYYISEQKVLGQRIDTLDIAILINRPLPGNLNEGRWHLVYYRRDCEHCHDILTRFFGKDLPAPTIAVEMPDTDGAALPMPCKDCKLHTLPKGPDYVIMPPLVMTVQDGIVVGITTDVDKKGAVEAVLNAGKPDSKPVDGALVVAATPAKAPDAPPSTPAAERAKPAVAAKPFPPAPAQLESFYAPRVREVDGPALRRRSVRAPRQAAAAL